MSPAALLPGPTGQGEAGQPTVLSRLQRGIESLYRVNTRVDVEAFLIDDESRRQHGVARSPREQLLIREPMADDDELSVGLFLDHGVVENLERHDPERGLDGRNFSDFCLAVEGVSHFIYVVLCAAEDRSVSALELELQAEIDKFACCFLLAAATFGRGRSGAGGRQGAANDSSSAGRSSRDARQLAARLYDNVTYAADLDGEERERYRTANVQARRYAGTLARRFVAEDRVGEMLRELRVFYRLGLDAKLSHIARSD